MEEKRPNEKWTDRPGITMVRCPYCGTDTKCYTWSLAGAGKRCQCGALHGWTGWTYAPVPKKPKKRLVPSVTFDACPVCNRPARIRRDGSFYSHFNGRRKCPGSGMREDGNV